MKVIGLAGKAGSGKSAIARHLASRGDIEWIDLDRIAWGTYPKGSDVYARLIQAFGGDILNDALEIDRSALGRLVFSSAANRDTLDAIVHPAVAEALERLIVRYRAEGTRVLLVEGALLASSAYVDRRVFDQILWLEASETERLRRLDAMGRASHGSRNRDIAPSGDVRAIEADGSVQQVADRVMEAVFSS